MSSRVPEPADPFEEEGLPTGGDFALDAKRITGDEQEGIPTPSDRPASEQWGTTGFEEQEGAPLDLRLSAEEPDVGVATRTTADADGNPYPADPDERAGRIVEPDEGARSDTEDTTVAYDVGTDSGGFSEEERAMHVEPEA